MTVYPNPLNEDNAGIKTTGEFGDPGDGGADKWYHWFRTANGGNAALGSTTDAAQSNPATNASLIAFTRGILTQLVTLVTSAATLITSSANILTKVTAGALSVTKLEDAPHASGDAGVMTLAVRKDTAAVSSGATGDYEPLQTDALGRLRVTAKRDATDALLINHMTALGASRVVKATPGTLHSIVGYVDFGENGWIQVHDVTSLPSNGAVPELSFYVGALDDPQPVNIPLPGHVCATGITLTWSTTGATQTAGNSKMMVVGYYE